MSRRCDGQEPLQERLAMAKETPSHPRLAAGLLMAGIILFLIVVSLVPLL